MRLDKIVCDSSVPLPQSEMHLLTQDDRKELTGIFPITISATNDTYVRVIAIFNFLERAGLTQMEQNSISQVSS